MKKRNVIILIAILALLSGSYIYISYHPVKKNTGGEQNKIELVKWDAGKINKIVLNSDKGTLELNKNGDTWTAKGYESIKLSQQTVQGIASTFATLAADKVIDDNPKDLNQYELSPAKSSAAFTLADGSRKNMLLGSKTPQGDSYYMMMEGDPKLYLLSSTSGDMFNYGIADLRDRNIFTADASALNYIKIVLPDGRIEEIKKVEKGSAEEKQFTENTWVMTKPYNMIYSVTDATMSDILNSVSQVTADEFVSDNPADLQKYGLDKPSIDVTAKAGSANLHLLMSKKTDDSKVYFKTDNSNDIYEAGSSMYDAFNKEPMELISKFIYVPNIDDVDEISIETGKIKNTMTLKRQKKPAQKQGEADTTVTTYTVNGKTVEETKFKDFYQSMVNIHADSENDKRDLPDQPEVRITYVLNKGDTKKVVLDYCPYNADFYAAFKDGKSDFVVSRDQVQQMIKGMQSLAK